MHGLLQILEMTAKIAELEVQAQAASSIPATPRQSTSPRGNSKDNAEVLRAREEKAKLQGYIVNAGNIDAQKDEEGPRPVSPVKKEVKLTDMPLVRDSSMCSVAQYRLR